VSTPNVAVRPVALRWVLDPVVLVPLGVLVGLLATWWAMSAGASQTRAAIDLAVFWAFVAAAMLALPRPALRRSGVLMLAVAATWFLYELQLSSSPLLWTIGLVTAYLYQAVAAQLVVSYPGGRLWSLSARIVVAGAYVVTVGMSLVMALFRSESRNLLLVSPDQGRVDRLDELTAAAGLVVTLAFVVVVAARLLSLHGAARRIALPMLVGALLATPITVIRLGFAATGDFATYESLDLVDRLFMLFIPLGFGIGVLWSRLQHSGASSLVVELRDGGSETLRDRLAGALGDPTLEVLYWSEASSEYVNAEGRPARLPDAPSRAVTYVVSGEKPVAALVHDPALLSERELVESVRATAALVLENERLTAEIREQLAEVQASRARIVSATDEERRRLERDLHDGAQQRLVGLSLKLALAQVGADPKAAEALANAQDDLESALAELREFARGVHPSILREDGLDAGVQALARRASVPIEVTGSVGGRLPDAVELAAYFFVSEALTNVTKHARATSVTIALTLLDAALIVTVSDDGVGGADTAHGSGLAGLSDRLAALEGRLDVESLPGLGTTLTATIPCGS
jgi:signal transduction histidine kinase